MPRALLLLLLIALPALAGEVVLTASNPNGVRLPWGVALGVPFPVGALQPGEPVALIAANGRPVPLQADPLCRWWGRDGSVQILLVRFVADPAVPAYRLVYGAGTPANPAPQTAVAARREGDTIRVSTGPLRAELNISAPRLLDALWYREQPVLVPRGGLRSGGFVSSVPSEQLEIEEAGPVRAVVMLRGHLTGPGGGKQLGYLCRLTFWAGLPTVAMDVTFVQDTGRVFADVPPVSFSVGLPDRERQVRLGSEPAFERLPRGAGLELRQLGPERPQGIQGLDYEPFKQMNDERRRWRSPAEDGLWDRDERHKTWDATWRRGGEQTRSAERTDGWVTLDDGAVALSAGIRWFWQLHPKDVQVTSDTLEFNLAPQPLHLHLGTAKTHSLLFACHAPGDLATAAAYRLALDRPPFYHPSPEWNCASRVWGDTAPRRAGRFRAYEERAEDELTSMFERQVERNNLYGMFDYGDLLYSGGQWLNMETALDYGLFIQFVRTGERKYYDWFERAVNHFRDVDVSHGELTEGPFDYGLWLMPGYMPERLARECARTDAEGEKLRADLFYYLGDQPPPMGGIRRHSFNHYQNAGFTPARLDTQAVEKRGRLYGGTCTVGGHGWIIGTLAHYLLTGDRYSLDTAKLTGELILDKLAAPIEGRDNWKNVDAVHLYRATGDARYRDLALRAVDYHYGRRSGISGRVAAQEAANLMSPYYTIGQFIRDYHDQTGDAEVGRKLVEMVGEWLDAVEKTEVPSGVGPVFQYFADFLDSRCHGDFADLAFCYRLTGERRFVDRGLPSLDLYLYHGYHSTALFEMPRVLAALDALGVDPADRPWRGTLSGSGKLTAWADKRAGQAVRTWISQSSGYRVRVAPVAGRAVWTGPDGTVVAERAITRGGLDAFRLDLPPEAPPGLYRLAVEAPGQQLQAVAEPALASSPPAVSVATPAGRGVRLTEGARLRYPAAGNVPDEAGTLEVAVQPLWDNPAARTEAVPYHYYHLFDSRDEGYDYGLTLHIWDGGETNAGRILTGGFADRDKATMVTAPCRWQAGEWHRLALTWRRTGPGKGSVALYVDGQTVAESLDAANFPSRTYRAEPPDLFVLGMNTTLSPNTPATAVLDWVRISAGVRETLADAQPAADAATTFLATFDSGAPFRAEVARGGTEPR
ncbi:MAG: hypothetical protein HYU66_09185 [Armatimonadetes bacterium]|nr:hypothetical protein [Armatimonadota bacterium]